MEMKDPAIKLFGKTIPVAGDDQDSPRESNGSSYSSANLDYADKKISEEETMETDDQIDNDPSEAAKEEETADEKESSNDPKNSQHKTLKKPDKILPCPRCNSMDTKFCYYNNYNVNQPRHFCKSCQRYWTAGGTMRNVPVGAGRRKNKTSVSRYCNLTISEALQSNGTVLTFGSENPLCESMVSVLNIADHQINTKKGASVTVNGFHQGTIDGGDDRSSGSTVTTTSSMEDGLKKGPQEPIKQNLNGFSVPNQMPCFQWPYMWNSTIPVPPFCPPAAFPMPFYPGPPPPPPPYWNIHWVPTQTSPTLGKHPRDGEMLTGNGNGNGKKKGLVNPTVLVPKTLRIDDPDEAAKSSIWTTLGIISKEKGGLGSTSKAKGGGFFNSLHLKKGEKGEEKREANPAALCRSVTFHENT